MPSLPSSNLHGRGAVADASPVKFSMRSRILARRLVEAQPLDALLAMGTDQYDLRRVVPHSLPIVTYDDDTFALFLRHPESPARQSGFPEPEIRRWAARQASAARWATACCVSTQWAAASLIDDYGIPTLEGACGRHRPPTAPVRAGPRLVVPTASVRRCSTGSARTATWCSGHSLASAPCTHGRRWDVVGDHPTLDLPGVTGHGFLARENRDAQRKLDALYACATAFVLPSRYDPAGIAYLEAASAGLPVITTTEGGAQEMLGDAAIAVHPDDEDGLTDAMRRLADPATAQRLGLAAHCRVADSTWPAVAQRIIASLGKGVPSLVA